MTDVITDCPPNTRIFVITGEICAWDSLTRELQIGSHLVSVAPSVSIVKLKCGATVTVLGQEDRLSARWIVTDVALRIDTGVPMQQPSLPAPHPAEARERHAPAEQHSQGVGRSRQRGDVQRRRGNHHQG
jgi:hypothetical protein